jgi:hypothetical protein
VPFTPVSRVLQYLASRRGVSIALISCVHTKTAIRASTRMSVLLATPTATMLGAWVKRPWRNPTALQRRRAAVRSREAQCANHVGQVIRDRARSMPATVLPLAKIPRCTNRRRAAAELKAPDPPRERAFFQNMPYSSPGRLRSGALILRRQDLEKAEENQCPRSRSATSP